MIRCTKQHGPHIEPSAAGKPWSDGQCRLCFRELNGASGTARPAQTSAPCEYLGEPLSGREREAAGLSHTMQWRHCLHTLQPLGPHVCVCKGCGAKCPGYTADEPLIINHGAGGLGDALLGSCAVKGLARLHPDRAIRYKVNPKFIPFVQLFDAGYDDLAANDWDNCADVPKRAMPGDIQMNGGYGSELRTMAKETRIGRWCRNLGGVTPERPALRDRTALLHAAPAEHRGSIVLSPFSTWRGREYPIQSFKTIERMLLEVGYRILTLDAADARWPGRHKQMRGEKLLDAPAETVAGVMLHSPCVVSNDSGLAHLGAMLDVPTLVLCGQTSHREIYGYYGPHVRALEGHLDCRGCYWQSPYQSSKCDPVCPNLASNTPEEIVAAVMEMAGPPKAGGGETGKAHERRLREGWFERYVAAPAIDIGCGRDPLIVPFPVRRWDRILGDGDAMRMHGMAAEIYATVYASHVLEHLPNPAAALRRWFELVKPGGHLIVCAPHRDLYEGQEGLPSRWNADHKTFWLPLISGSGAPPHLRGLYETIQQAIPGGTIVSLRTLDADHHSYPGEHPQGEYSIEAIVRK